MNVVKNLTDRINARLAETKRPAKSYATQDRAYIVADELAFKLAEYWNVNAVQDVHYLVVQANDGRFYIGFDINRVLLSAPTGGYVGAIIGDHFTY